MSIEQKIRQDVEAILGPTGLAVQQGLMFNDNQYIYAMNVAAGFSQAVDPDETVINAQQAATGTGKTLGYLVPLMSYCVHALGPQGLPNRVAVSTYTRHLQKQILDKDAKSAIEWIHQVTGKRLSVALRVGMKNHLSLKACTSLLDAFKADDVLYTGEHVDFLESAIAFLSKCPQCITIDDYLSQAGVDALPDRIDRARIGLLSTAPKPEIERYRALVQETKDADVLITNHALSVMNAWGFNNFLDNEDRRTTVCVFDEADRLEDMCRSMVTSEVSIRALKTLIETLSSASKRLIQTTNINDLYDYLVSLYSDKGDRFKLCDDRDGEGTTIAHKLNLVILDLEVCAHKLKKDPGAPLLQQLEKKGRGSIDELKADVLDTLEQVKTLRRMMKVANAKGDQDQGDCVVVSWSPVKSYPSLRVGRIRPGRILESYWGEENPVVPKKLRAALFTSATLDALSDANAKPEFKELFGKHGIFLDRPKVDWASNLKYRVQKELLQSFEPHDFGKLTFVLPDSSVNSPTRRIEEDGEDDGKEYCTDPDWLRYCASMILTASHRKGSSPHAPGRTLVLTTSYADAESLAQLLVGTPSLFVHKKGKPLSTYLSDFEAQDGAILITPGAWEGLDKPNLIKNLVITRMPFPRPNSIENQLRELQFRRSGAGNPQNAIRLESLSTVVRRLKQGLGRAIRSYNDEATVWIADPRFPRHIHANKRGSNNEPLTWEKYSQGNRNASGRPARQVPMLRKAIPGRFDDDYCTAKVFTEHGALS
ncbi:ATP-dependent DNA helicase [Pseudomonas taiwanensis]|uniref:ATP-dependent DNA helicase n=1 Tax=Pseudomonas taiwanensis TaxID=470150 RepID=UPI0028DFCD3A|nr:ATP-dependent DNA helicase [Pseudomonas taiwanensis]MDT8925212.1 ATP-dependent DNA helicase [Pseudomonas taiwanensis]